jgi:hypothetical protein
MATSSRFARRTDRRAAAASEAKSPREQLSWAIGRLTRALSGDQEAFCSYDAGLKKFVLEVDGKVVRSPDHLKLCAHILNTFQPDLDKADNVIDLDDDSNVTDLDEQIAEELGV